MRLRDYQDLINRAIPIIEKFTISQQPISGYPGTYQVVNVQNFLRIIEELKQANLFSDELSRIMETPNLNNSIENTITINNQSKNTLSSLKNELLSSARLLQKALKEVLTDEDENVLNLKLPSDYSSINDYVKFFDALKDICAPFKYAEEEVTIANFDVGSEWIGVKFIGSSISLFLTLADKGASLFAHVLECQKTFEDLEKAKIDKSTAKIKHIEETINLLKEDKEKEKKEYIDNLIEEAIKESKFVLNETISQNEFKNHLRIALEKLSGLLIQGLEIVPALTAKPQIKQLTQKVNKNIEEKKKLIIGCDNQKYLTMLNSTVDTKEIPADTLEINNSEE